MGIPSWVEDLSEIRMNWIKQNKAIERIRELHHPFNPGSSCDCCVVEDECDVCGEYYPCETIKSLEGIK
jgi:hypothetical protein